MGMNFPNSPTVGAKFTQGGVTWRWNGYAWDIVPNLVAPIVSDTPPPDPADDQLWLNSTNLVLYCWYNDGNSKQWIQTNGSPAISGPWEPIYVGGFTTTGNEFKVPNLGAYDMLRGQMQIHPSASGGGLYMQVSADNGNTWLTPGYYSEYHNVKGASPTGLYAPNDGQVALAGAFTVATTGLSFSFEAYAFNKPTLQGRFNGRWGGDDGVLHEGYSYSYLPIGTRSAIKFYSGGGTLTGRLVMEGVRG